MLYLVNISAKFLAFKFVSISYVCVCVCVQYVSEIQNKLMEKKNGKQYFYLYGLY